VLDQKGHTFLGLDQLPLDVLKFVGLKQKGQCSVQVIKDSLGLPVTQAKGQ
jgi:hypothetical protein